jgi:hypothetical protein
MKARVLNFRLDEDTEDLLDAWLAKNPGFTLSQLGNLALRSFVTKPFVLEPVSSQNMTDEAFFRAAEVVLEEHADALERLK